MQLIEKEHCYLIDDFFPSSITAGFTKPNLAGSLPRDIKKAVSFAGSSLKVGFLNQLHSSQVHYVKEQGMYQGDGLFSEEKDLSLVVKTADCLPLFFAEKKGRAAGVIHMGWRGAEKNILDNIDYDLSSFRAAAGCGLRKCCYEVGREFLDYEWAKGYLSRRQARLYFDPVSFARDKLYAKGLSKEDFLDLNVCSFCSDEGFFSHRKTKTASRTCSFIIKTL